MTETARRGGGGGEGGSVAWIYDYLLISCVLYIVMCDCKNNVQHIHVLITLVARRPLPSSTRGKLCMHLDWTILYL